MKHVFQGICAGLITAWVLCMAMSLGFGLAFVRGPRCQEPLSRIEYVIPGFQLGCWLGSVPAKDKP